jgi:hypothetical protein
MVTKFARLSLYPIICWCVVFVYSYSLFESNEIIRENLYNATCILFGLYIYVNQKLNISEKIGIFTLIIICTLNIIDITVILNKLDLLGKLLLILITMTTAYLISTNYHYGRNNN